MKTLEANIDAAIETFQALRELGGELQIAADIVRNCLTHGHKLLTAGNGGSFADAAHLATEFVCRFDGDRAAFPAIALGEPSTMVAVGNDYEFADVFARQVQAFARAGDVLIVLSTSGNSENIRRALVSAKEKRLATIALLGRGGGFCAGLATVELIVPGEVTARIQEGHKLLYHTLCEMVEPALKAYVPAQD